MRSLIPLLVAGVVLSGCGQKNCDLGCFDVKLPPKQPVDMARPHTVCDDDPWIWVRSPDDLGNEQGRVLIEGIFTVLPYKDGKPSEADQWSGVVHKIPQGERCYPMLQSWGGYTSKEHATIDCNDVATSINVTFPRQDTISILINCVPTGRATAYQVTRKATRSKF